jgi:translation initiation factor IF-1
VNSKLGWLEEVIKHRMLKNLGGRHLLGRLLQKLLLRRIKRYAGDEIRVGIDPEDKNKINISIDDVCRIWE